MTRAIASPAPHFGGLQSANWRLARDHYLGPAKRASLVWEDETLIYPTRSPPPAPAFVPNECLSTRRRSQTWCLWTACHGARRGNAMALCLLRDMVRARPSDRLAYLAYDTLASLDYEWLLETRGGVG